MPPIFNPLSNRGTSLVLFLLVSGIDTPTSLAEKLGVGAPVVVRQLQRLRRIHVVTLGKKTGRERRYAINWEKLVEIAVHRSLYLPQWERTVGEDGLLKDQLLRKEKFRKFVQAYFRVRISQQLGVGTPLERVPLRERDMRTFAELLGTFHITVLSMMIQKRLFTRLETEDQALQQVTEALKSWTRAGLSLNEKSEDAFGQALEKVGFKIDWKAYRKEDRRIGDWPESWISQLENPDAAESER